MKKTIIAIEGILRFIAKTYKEDIQLEKNIISLSKTIRSRRQKHYAIGSGLPCT